MGSAGTVSDGLFEIGWFGPNDLVLGKGRGNVTAGVRLDAVNLDIRVDSLRGDGAAADEPSAANAHDEMIELTRLLKKLKSDGALPGDNLLVVERVDERHAGLLGLLLNHLVDVLLVAVEVVEFGPVAAHSALLELVSVLRDDDLCPDAHELARECDALAVIAGGVGQYTFLALLRREIAEGVEGAAELKAACLLKVFAFDEDIYILTRHLAIVLVSRRKLGQLTVNELTRHDLSAVSVAFDGLGRFLNVLYGGSCVCVAS